MNFSFLGRIYLLAILAILLHQNSFSQKVNEDSLQLVIKQTKQDTSRVMALRKLASYYILHKGEDAAGLSMLSQAEELARNIHFQIGICEVLLTRGNYYFRKNDWTNAIAALKELDEQSNLLTDTLLRNRTKMKALNNLAGIYVQNGDYTSALDYYLKSRGILEKLPPDPSELCLVYVNIASMYNVLDQNDKAEEYLGKCYPLLNTSKEYLRYIYWQERQTLSDKKKDAKQVALAIDSLEKTLQSSKLSEFQQTQYTETLHQMKGKFKADYQRDYDGAIESFKAMLDLSRQMEDHVEISSALFQIGDCYYRKGDVEKSKTYLLDAYKNALADSVNQVVFTASKLLSDIFRNQKQDGKALEYLSVAYQMNDSLNKEKNLEQLNFLEASYQNEKKEKEIAELRTTNAEKELAVVKRNRMLLITGITALALLLVMGLLYRTSKQKQTIAENEQRLKEEKIRFLERQQQVVSLQSMINGQETERIRIAKDLHDGLGGVFSTVKMHYSTLQQDTPAVKENPLYKKTLDLIDNASDELRKVAHNMMPEVLMKVGLVEALRDFCDNITSGKLIKMTLQTFGMEKRLGNSTEIMLYRIIQELVNNIIKHANATEAVIQINREGNRLSLTIEDNGRGFNTREADEKQTMGMATVKSRVDYLNGSLTIDSRKDIGTTVMIDLLLNEN